MAAFKSKLEGCRMVIKSLKGGNDDDDMNASVRSSLSHVNDELVEDRGPRR